MAVIPTPPYSYKKIYDSLKKITEEWFYKKSEVYTKDEVYKKNEVYKKSDVDSTFMVKSQIGQEGKNVIINNNGIVDFENKNNHEHDIKALNFESGGTNLLWGTQDFNYMTNDILGEILPSTYRNCYVRRYDNTQGDTYMYHQWRSALTVGDYARGDKYTLSFWAKGEKKIRARLSNDNNVANDIIVKNYTTGGIVTQNSRIGAIDFLLTSNWKRYFVTWEISNQIQYNNLSVDIGIENGGQFDVCGVMFEKGDIPHDWCPSPNDASIRLFASQNNLINIDDEMSSGFYSCLNEEAQYISGCPLPANQNKAFYLLVEKLNHGNRKQTLTYYDTKNTYIRIIGGLSNSWSDWKKISMEESNDHTSLKNIQVTEAQSLNSFTTIGQYLIDDTIENVIANDYRSSLPNDWDGYAFVLDVRAGWINDNHKIQFIYTRGNTNNNKIYWRNKYNDSWKPWQELVAKDSLTSFQNNINTWKTNLESGLTNWTPVNLSNGTIDANNSSREFQLNSTNCQLYVNESLKIAWFRVSERNYSVPNNNVTYTFKSNTLQSYRPLTAIEVSSSTLSSNGVNSMWIEEENDEVTFKVQAGTLLSGSKMHIIGTAFFPYQ